MSSEAMRARISAQPASLARVLEHQCGQGREALVRAAELIRSRPQVVITGMGASFFAALPLETQLCAMGINAMAVEAGELLHFRYNAYREAVVVAVSRSGESIEIAKLLALLKGRQPVIGISNRSQSRLAKEADVAIEIGSLEDEVVALQTYTGTVLQVGLLGSAVEGTLSTAKQEVETLLPHFDQLVRESLANLRDWDEFVGAAMPLYLLARGASQASALEGALLVNEVAKLPAVAMATATFRHGPVEVVNEAFRGLIFAPEGETQHLNLALAKDIERFGGQVRVLGPLAREAAGVPVIHLPSTRPMWAPLFEIVPLQAAALRAAELRGVVPGNLRIAAPVALDEASFG
jgi:glutamine---fructose-6-phosphate transaminase (isomerizing)